MEKHQHTKDPANKFMIGKYMFEYPVNHPKKKPIHRQIIKQLRNQQSKTLNISWGKYKRFKWNTVIKFIKESQVQIILAYGNTDRNILLTISTIKFQNLKLLDLTDCHIQNIEPLPDSPLLNDLSLSQNNITSISTLHKKDLSHLKTLLLNDNPIMTMGLERCNFQLETFWLERKYNVTTIKECLSQTGLFKLKSWQMKDISIESLHRIHQGKMLSQITKKFSKLERLLQVEPDEDQESQDQIVGYLSEEDQALPVDHEETSEDTASFTVMHSMNEDESEDWFSESDEFLNE